MTTINTSNVPSTYAAQPGYQPVPTQQFNQPPPPAYTPGSGYAPAGQSVQYNQNIPPQAGYSQQSSSNVVVVQQQAAVIPVIARPEGYQPDAGHAALMFALVVTIISLVCGCWWSIVCSVPGIVFANSATSAGFRGDRESIRSNNNLSYGATIAAIVSGVVGVGIIVGLVFGLRPYYYYCRYCY